jgi:hypothetical protein
MEEMRWIDGLDQQQAADAVVEVRARLLRAEADRLALAVHWADLHDSESVTGSGSGHVLPGSERAVLVGGDGTPQVAEFAVAELAVLMQVSLAAAASLIADGLDLRHRMPLLWTAVQERSIDAWKARKVAARLRSCGLSQAQALWVDMQVTPYVGSLSWNRLWDRLEGKIIEVDPEAAEERAQAQAMARFVRTGRSNEYGLSTIVARASAGDALFFVAMCDRLAQILALEGDSDPVDVRRSKAIGILADPARALAMLQRHAALDDDEQPVTDESGAEDERTGEDDRDPGGHGDKAGAIEAAAETTPDPGAGESGDGSVAGPVPASAPSATAGAAGTTGTHCTTCGATTGDPTAFVRPMRVDPAKLRPAATLFIHTSREAWERGRSGAAGAGVARVEGIGPVTLEQAVEMLGHTNVTVRGMIDLAEDRPVDGYEVPERMREILFQRSPGCVFPWSGGAPPSRRRDVDHTVPYLSPDKGGPPGQTRIGNLGFLNRKPHRVKTHAPGWRHHQPEPGVHYWRTPTGYWFRVDHRGSHALGRDPALPWTGEPVETSAPGRPPSSGSEQPATGADLCWPLRRHSAGEAILLDLLAG